jgi:hypothetical protein
MGDAPDNLSGAQDQAPSLIAFEGWRRIASGPLAEIEAAVQQAMARAAAPVLVFDAATSWPVEIAPAGAPRPPATPAARGRGRPRMGVAAREVTLLPRHWAWLGRQHGGASAALRRLVEGAMRTHLQADRVREAREAAYRFMSAMAGNLPGFEEATRALFRGDEARLAAETATWPADVRDHARGLAAAAFDVPESEPISPPAGAG